MKIAKYSSRARRSVAALAVLSLAAASAPAFAQSLWGVKPAADAPPAASSSAAQNKPDEAQGFMAADLPDENFLRALNRSAMSASGAADCILVTRAGEIPVKGSEQGDYLRAWSDFTDQQSVIPMGGMELGIKSGAISALRVASHDNGVGGDQGVLRAFVLSKGATASFDEHFAPLLTQAPGEKPKVAKDGLRAQILFGPSGQRVAVRRDATNSGAEGVSHYSVRQGEGLILAIPGDGVIRWIALAAFPLPPGALSQAK